MIASFCKRNFKHFCEDYSFSFCQYGEMAEGKTSNENKKIFCCCSNIRMINLKSNQPMIQKEKQTF